MATRKDFLPLQIPRQDQAELAPTSSNELNNPSITVQAGRAKPAGTDNSSANASSRFRQRRNDIAGQMKGENSQLQDEARQLYKRILELENVARQKDIEILQLQEQLTKLRQRHVSPCQVSTSEIDAVVLYTNSMCTL